MTGIKEEAYRGWKITVTAEDTLCAHFSFTLTDQTGHRQNISMGGHSQQRALERAREMIDMELELGGEE